MLRLLRNIAVNAVVSVMSLVLGLVLLELALDAIKPHVAYSYMPQQIYMSHFRSSTLLPYELRPSARERFAMLDFDTTVVTNSLGLRGPEVDGVRPQILCAGDSMAFGFGVENDQTFCSLLEQRFAGKYQFVDTAMADGYSPDTYALWLRTRGAALKPHGIIVTIHQSDYGEVAANRWLRDGQEMTDDDTGNPDRIESPGTFVTTDGAWLRDSRVARLDPWLRRLIKRSYIVALLRDRLMRDASAGDGHPPTRDDGAFLRQDRRFLRSLEMLRLAAGDRLIAFYRIYGRLDYGGNGIERDPPSPESVRLDRLIAQFATEHNIRLISNYDEFHRPADFLRSDGHWNPSGHRTAADFLYRELVSFGY